MKILNWKNTAFGLIIVCSVFLFNSCGIESSVTAYDDIYADDEQIAFEEQNYNRIIQQSTYKDSRYNHDAKQYREQVGVNQSQDSIQEDFDMDDYYDYAYTARLHRFHSNAPIYDNYYDDYYTNLYWYDRDLALWGTSIYLGYSWWWPSYAFRWGWYGNPWYYDWYGWGWHHGWYDYAWGGWCGGFHHHHYGCGRDPWYYNSYDNNSGFYRPTHDGGSFTRANARGNITRGDNTISRNNNSTFADKYNNRYGNTISRGNATNNSTIRNNNTISRNTSNITRNSSTISTNTNSRLQKPVTRPTNNLNRNGNVSNKGGNSGEINRNSTINRNNNSTIKRNNNGATQQRRYTPPAQRQQRSSDVRRSNSNRSSYTRPNSNRNMNNPSRSSSTSRSSSRSNSSINRSSSSSRSSSIGRSSGSHSSGSMSRGGGSHGGGRR